MDCCRPQNSAYGSEEWPAFSRVLNEDVTTVRAIETGFYTVDKTVAGTVSLTSGEREALGERLVPGQYVTGADNYDVADPAAIEQG